MKVLLDIDEEYYNQAVMLNTKVGEFLRKGRPINDHVTVTNGDVFKTLFPCGDLHDYDYYNGYVIYELNYKDFRFDRDWWYAPYNKEKAVNDIWYNEWLDEVSKDETT